MAINDQIQTLQQHLLQRQFSPQALATRAALPQAQQQQGLLGRIPGQLFGLFNDPAQATALSMAAALLESGAPRPVGENTFGAAIGHALTRGQATQNLFAQQANRKAIADAQTANAAAKLASLQPDRMLNLTGTQANQILGQETYAPTAMVPYNATENVFGTAVNPPGGAAKFVTAATDIPGVAQQGQPFTAIENDDGTFSVDTGQGLVDIPGTSVQKPVEQTEDIGLQKKTLSDLEGSINEGTNQIAEFKSLRDNFEPDALTFFGKGKVAMMRFAEKSKIPLTDDQKEEFSRLTGFASQAKRRLNEYIQAVTGAQLSVFEAERIRGGVPDPERDSPTEFIAKYDNLVAELEAALKRAEFAKSTGRLSNPWEVGSLSRFGGAESKTPQVISVERLPDG